MPTRQPIGTSHQFRPGPAGPAGPAGPVGNWPPRKSTARKDPFLTFALVTALLFNCFAPTLLAGS